MMWMMTENCKIWGSCSRRVCEVIREETEIRKEKKGFRQEKIGLRGNEDGDTCVYKRR